MCLIAFAYKVHPVYNLVLAANRDEFFARPTKAVHYWTDVPNLYAGRDLKEGGTWLGLTRDGKFSAVTNYRDGPAPQQREQSRGRLTVDFLSGPLSADTFFENLTPSASAYGGFNLLCGDADGLHYLSNAGGGRQTLNPGIFGLSNAHLDTPWPKVVRAKHRLQNLLEQPDVDPLAVMRILHDRQPAADEDLPNTGIPAEWEKLLSAAFIRADEYGTRCTTVLLQEYSGRTLFLECVFDQHGASEEKQEILSSPCIG